MSALIKNVDPHGDWDVGDLVEELATQFGGNMLKNALKVREMCVSRRKPRRKY